MSPRTVRQAPDLLSSLPSSNGAPAGSPWWVKMVVIALTLAVLGGGFLGFRLTSSVSGALMSATGTEGLGFFGQLRQLVIPPERSLRGEEEDRIHILLLGMGGEGHEGALLTDTIIVASYQPSTHRVGLLSIPRDLVVRIPGYEYRKINNANALGEDRGNPGSGIALAVDVVEDVIGAPIHYYARVDFTGFEQAIDDLGGIDLVVDKAFVDYQYPTEDFRAQTIRFEAGKQQMTGARALQYVRSRHGTNGEGSDFARSERQQKVLVAFKEKVFSLSTLFNPTAIADAITTFGKHIHMNFEPWEVVKLARLAKDVDPSLVVTRVLDSTEQGLLKSDTGIDGAYILVPRAGLGKYSDIQEAFRSLGETEVTPTIEPAVVEIQNGTTITGLAAKTSQELASLPVTIARVRNAADRDTEITTIYDLTGGMKPEAVRILKEALAATVTTTLPTILFSDANEFEIGDIGSSLTNSGTLDALRQSSEFRGIDIVVVLGKDRATTNSSTP